MELHNAYHEIRSLQFKVSEYDALIKNAQEPELKIAYSTIQSPVSYTHLTLPTID
jgi:hypothetical protein